MCEIHFKKKCFFILNIYVSYFKYHIPCFYFIFPNISEKIIIFLFFFLYNNIIVKYSHLSINHILLLRSLN